MIAFIIGVLLTLGVIWLLKGTRITPCCYPHKKQDEKPVLKVWSFVLLLITALIPIVNILLAIVVFTVWVIQVTCEKDWDYVRPRGKIVKFLNKPIQ